jgi:uncharacterized damage-inducible protein DinB
MQHNFPYEPGYIGELKEFSPLIATDLEKLVRQLNPHLAHGLTEKNSAYSQHSPRFKQIIAVEEQDGRPTIVGTANISTMHLSLIHI